MPCITIMYCPPQGGIVRLGPLMVASFMKALVVLLLFSLWQAAQARSNTAAIRVCFMTKRFDGTEYAANHMPEFLIGCSCKKSPAPNRYGTYKNIIEPI